MSNKQHWYWTLINRDGAEVLSPSSPVFLSRSGAETWLGETWRHLAAETVREAVLYGPDHRVHNVVVLRSALDAYSGY